MKYLALILLFTLASLNNKSYAQQYPCDESLYYNNYGNSVIYNFKSYVELSPAAKQYVRQKALHHHNLYLQYYKSDERKIVRNQRQLCRKLKRDYVVYHEIFHPKYFEFLNMPAPDEKIPDKSFLILPYASPNFNQYKLRWAITTIPDSLRYDSAERTSIPLVDIGYPSGPQYYREHPDVRPISRPYIFEDKHGEFYHFDNYCIYSPLHIAITKAPDGDTMKYALYEFHEEANKTAGVVAVNIADSSDLFFLAGPFLPFGFDVPVNMIIDQLAQRPLEDPIHSVEVRNELIKKLNLDKDFDFTWYNGVQEYAKFIASGFMYMPRYTEVLEINDGYYTVSISASVYTIRYIHANRQYCKKVDANPGEIQARGVSTIFRKLVIPPYLLCSDINGRVVSKMHIRINPETGDVQLKIAERSNIRRIPVCPE